MTLQSFAPTDRGVGWLAVAAGAVLVLAVQVLAPVGVPLYDGVAVQEPYRFLHPSGDQPGSPSSFSATVQVTGPDSPQVTAPTTESPPQAQLIALPGAFTLPAGATSLSVSVTPVEAPPVPAGGEIAGNVYRFTIVDQAGAPVVINACEGCISLVMRAPESLTGAARLQRFADGAWTDIETVHAGILGMYATNPTALGDYAVVTGGDGGPGTPGPGEPGVDDPSERGLGIESYIVAGGAVVILVLFFVAALVLRRRPSPLPEAPRSRAVPSKRKRPPRPPDRSDDR
jgi:hypothetical protein